MKKLLVILFATLFLFTSCADQQEALQQEQDMGTIIDSLTCGDAIDWFGTLGRVYFIERLDALRERHETSMGIAGKAYTMTVLVSDDVPYGKYLLTPQTPPIDYFLKVSVRSMQQSPAGGMVKYLTIEKICQ
jgi:hypothetical protein